MLRTEDGVWRLFSGVSNGVTVPGVAIDGSRITRFIHTHASEGLGNYTQGYTYDFKATDLATMNPWTPSYGDIAYAGLSLKSGGPGRIEIVARDLVSQRTFSRTVLSQKDVKTYYQLLKDYGFIDPRTGGLRD